MNRTQDRKELAELREEWVKVQAGIATLETDRDRYVYQIRELLLSFPEVEAVSEQCGRITFFLPGNEKSMLSWDCSKSPIDTCVYDVDNDSALDHCLFCGEPHERK